MKSSVIYGLMAEFADPTSLVTATERAHREGYRCMDAYSPYPIEELHQALGSRHTRLPLIVLIGGLVGCIGGYALQYSRRRSPTRSTSAASRCTAGRRSFR